MNSRKNVTITTKLDKPVFLVADRYMLSTILRNLISNAVKFSFPGSEVVVSAVKEHDSILISVKDSGTGINEEDMQRLFTLDDQYRSTGTEGEKGTGLGLILAKEFTEKHGGSIEVRSTPGLGSTFTVKLPAAPDISRLS